MGRAIEKEPEKHLEQSDSLDRTTSQTRSNKTEKRVRRSGRSSRSRKKSRWKKMLKGGKRELIGLLLACLVGGIIYYVASKPKEPKTAGSWKANLGVTDSSRSSVDSRGGADVSAGLGAEEPDSQVVKSTEYFLNSSSPTELIEELIRLNDQHTNSIPAKFVITRQRAKIAKRLLEMDEATEYQRLFGTNDYIESVLMLDAMNLSGNLNDHRAREDFIEVGQKYSDHPNDSIGARASLHYVLIPLHDFRQSNDESKLIEVADQFELHADKIMRHEDSTGRLALIITADYRKHESSVELGSADSIRTMAIRIMKRLEKSEKPKIRRFAYLLGEQIYFGRLELESLIERIEGGNTLAEQDVQRLFEGLEAVPSTGPEVYIVATEIIAEYVRLEKLDRAQALTTWLVSINENNSDAENREKISQAIAESRKLQSEQANADSAASQ